LENVGGNFSQLPLGPPKNLNGDLYGTGFLSVDLPRSVNYLGGGGCEFVAFRYVLACAGELVETAGLTFHRFPILQPGGVLAGGRGPAQKSPAVRHQCARPST
jgi:hypothetical protein